MTNPLRTGFVELKDIWFTGITALRRLTFRVAFPQVFINTPDHLLRVLSSIASPIFCELVLEIGVLPPRFDKQSSMYWGRWEEIDGLLKKRFAKFGNFKLTIRTGDVDDRGTFQRHVKEAFPLLAKGEHIHFETSHLIEKYWL